MLDAWNDALHSGIPYNNRVYKELLTKKGMAYIEEGLKKRLSDGRILDKPLLDYAFRRLIGERLGTESMHATAAHIQNYIPVEWRNYFKFCFVRNPYSQAVSLYNWRTFVQSGASHLGCQTKNQENIKVSFKEFLRRLEDKHRSDHEELVRPLVEKHAIPGWAIYTLNDRIAVDYVGRFENLRSDMEKICNIVGIPSNLEKMPMSKKLVGSDSYQNFYDAECRDMVQRFWKKEFDAFSYDLAL